MKKKLKKNKNGGITLVALVITIIVLLILAGITLNLTLGENGLLKRAQQGENAHKLGEANDINSMDKATDYMNKYFNEESIIENLPENTPETEAGTKVKMPNEWYKDTPVTVTTPVGAEVTNTKRVASVEAIADGTGKTVPVPKGFVYVGGTIESGVVISDNASDKNKYAGEEKAPNGNVPAGVAYNADGTVNVSGSELQGNQFVWIPCTITNYTKVNFGSNMQNYTGQWDTSTNTAEEGQIRKYGGFYIARYEAGTSKIKLANNVKFENASTASDWQNGSFASSKVESGKITSKAGEIPYYNADYITAIEMSKEMYNTENVHSVLMTGTMWDVVMKYITTDNTSYLDLKNTPWGNYRVATEGVTFTSGYGRYMPVNLSNGSENFTVTDNAHHYGIRTTASSKGVKKNNIYDLAGNLWEWTQEMCLVQDVNQLMYNLRGGSFNNTPADNSVCFRAYSAVNHTSANIGFRPALYIM